MLGSDEANEYCPPIYRPVFSGRGFACGSADCAADGVFCGRNGVQGGEQLVGGIMEQDLYAEGYAAGVKAGRLQNTLRADARIKDMKDKIQDILCDVSDFLDNYTDAEYDSDGHIHGNRAMNLKASIDELL
jgi:hypothetical protein